VPTHRHDFDCAVQKDTAALMKSYSFLLVTLMVWLTSLNQAAKKLAPQIRAVTTANGIEEQSVNSLRHTGRLPGGVGKRDPTLPCWSRCWSLFLALRLLANFQPLLSQAR
jgi:hypothetical protein